MDCAVTQSLNTHLREEDKQTDAWEYLMEFHKDEIDSMMETAQALRKAAENFEYYGKEYDFEEDVVELMKEII
jgi:hypothetical protein